MAENEEPTVPGSSLTTVLVTLPRGMLGVEAGPRPTAAIRNLLSAIPRSRRLILAGHDAALCAAEKWPEIVGRKPTFVPVEDDIDFTVWAQDGLLAVHRNDGMPAFLLPAIARRPGNRDIIHRVAAALGIACMKAAFDFEGGNILIGSQHVLVGVDTPLTSEFLTFVERGGRRAVSIGSEEVLPRPYVRLVESDGTPIVEEMLGFAGLRQPLFHLDLFASLAGMSEDGRQVVFVGDVRLARRQVGNMLPEVDPRIADALDMSAQSLKATGAFLVLRNPLPIVPVMHSGGGLWSRAAVERRLGGLPGASGVMRELHARRLSRVAVRRWRALSQNCCVVFEDPDDRRVLLPKYAEGQYAYLEPCERHNAALWRQRGYRVTEVAGAQAFAFENGSLHCVLKEIYDAPAIRS